MNARRKFLSVGAATVAALGATLVTAPDASARSMRGCDFPRVCFYKTQADYDAHRPTAAYKDVTSGFQKLGSRARGSVKAVNTRNDDGAIVTFANKPGTVCVQADSWWHFGSDVVTHIRIVDSPTC
ncbi:hypothetical protein [Streptomyces buecherae]|uniref:Peptidase inhibitor family I36 protein n=1 Tax=Streptomyces buecherae TaxID=2763006 RepID=A0A7H8NEU7_9ACTN|nr:hypothetical protein [Streptomyces buecherae]QKW52974.1 hypothetical protein HUT08_29360 [Streptomyces buecherae]